MIGYLSAKIFGSLTQLVTDISHLYRGHIRTVMLGMANTLLGTWWLDGAVGLGIAGWAVAEGRRTWAGESCGCACQQGLSCSPVPVVIGEDLPHLPGSLATRPVTTPVCIPARQAPALRINHDSHLRNPGLAVRGKAMAAAGPSWWRQHDGGLQIGRGRLRALGHCPHRIRGRGLEQAQQALRSGRYPRAMFGFVEGVIRWNVRLTAYVLTLVTDRYPPFRLAP